jgi:hypothetical protein
MPGLANDRRRPKLARSKNSPGLPMPLSLMMTSLRRFRGILRTVANMCMYAVNVGITTSAMRKSPQLTRQEKSSWRRSSL